MRERFNPNAVCSSKNYTASKRAHKALLKARHASFALSIKAARAEEAEEITLKRRMLAPSTTTTKTNTTKTNVTTKVFAKLFGKLVEVTKDKFKEAYPNGKLYDSHGNEIFE